MKDRSKRRALQPKRVEQNAGALESGLGSNKRWSEELLQSLCASYLTTTRGRY